MKNLITRPRGIASLLATVALALGVQDVSYSQPPLEGNKIYWTEAKDFGWIQRADLDGSNLESLLTTELEINPNRITLDLVAGKIYWTEVDAEWEGTIRRANYDGSEVETLITGLHDPFDLALDLLAHKMYWTSLQGGTIQRADLEGTNVETLITGLEAPADIALDMYLYFIGDPCPTCATKIQAVSPSPDRPPAAKIASPSPTSDAPTKMFWTDRRAGTIKCADLDGSNVKTLVTDIGSPAGLLVAAYERVMVWTERDTGTIKYIQWADLDSASAETLVTGVEDIISIAQESYYGYYDEIVWMEWNSDSKIGTIRGYPRFVWDESGTSYTRTSYTITETKGPGDLDANGALYWTDTNRIYWIDRWAYREEYEITAIAMGIEGPTSIAVDVAEDKMYWVDKRTDVIRRSNLDGTNVEDLLTEVKTPDDIALDLVAGKMYWTEQGTGAIRRAGLDGTNAEILVEIKEPLSIALDVPRGKMYWTARVASSFSDAGIIQRADLNGENIETLLTGLYDPESIALDLVAGKMYWITDEMYWADRYWVAGRRYWADSGILRANLDGSNLEIVVPRLAQPMDLALDAVGRKIYWVDKTGGSIQRADLNGENVEEIVSGLVRPVGITLDVPIPDAPLDRKRTSRTEVVAVVLGDISEDLTVEFAQSTSEQPPHFAWSAVTDAAGWLALTISNPEESDTSGLYQARALTATGEVVGRWESISLDHGLRYVLELILEGSVRIVASQRLGVPNPDPCSNGIVVPDPLINRGLVEDCQALLEFRDNLDYTKNLNWSASKPITSWEEVVIRDFRVKELPHAYDIVHREGSFIGGPISPSLGRLTKLEYLSLGSHSLNGPIPVELGNLTNLTELDLHGNQLTGSIPPELGNLTNLTRLNLSENQLTGSIPPELGNLTELTRLDLSENQLTGPIPSELGNLTNLADFTRNRFPGLNLSENQLTGPIPPELGKLTQVKKFHLSGNKLTGPIPPELAHITQLDLSHNEMKGPIPHGLEQLTELTWLDLSHNELTGLIPPELGQLAQLEVLDLYDNRLTGPVPTSLGGLTKLRWVSLDNNQFTCVPEALAKWAEYLPICDATDSTATAADFDGDGATGFTDFFLFAEHFGSSDARFDLNASGTVDFDDFFLFTEHFDPPARAKLVAMAQELIGLPNSSQLQQNAPNPFNSQTILSYFLHSPGPARLEVFALTGQRVAVLHQGPQQVGYHRLRWNGHDDAGHPVASGMYLYRLVTDEAVLTRKLMLLR